MEFTSLGIVGVGAITAICYFIGSIVKNSKLNSKWIPSICAGSGMVLGIVALLIGMPDFPATDFLSAAAVGMASGWAATGINQTKKQLTNE